MLVGKTANARKTTAYQFALNLLEETAGLLDETRVKQLHGLASVEGLASEMLDPQATDPFRILCVEDEFRSLITKAGQRAVANLIPKLTELFNCPRAFEVNTKNNRIAVPNPFLCMLCATTRAWFEQSLTQRDVGGGFLNRWLLFEGEADKLLPSPPAVSPQAWEDLVIDVGLAVEGAQGHYTLSPDAGKYYENFYCEARRDFDSDATARTDLHARKLGLVYAILAGRRDNLIHQSDIESGAELAKYCSRVVEPLAASLDLSPQKRLEDRVMDRVKGAPGLTKRDLYRAMHVSSKQLDAVLEPLIKNSFISEKECGYYVG